MRLMIEARIDDGEGEAERDGSTIVATVRRRGKDLSKLGLTLAEGRSLPLGASHGFARSQAKRFQGPAMALDCETYVFMLGWSNGSRHVSKDSDGLCETPET